MATDKASVNVPRPECLKMTLQIKNKVLMGPGPSNCPARVLKALSLPILGHFHQATFKIMDEIKEGIRYIFQTNNILTLAISGSGHAGMEAAICNLIEPGERILILVNGIWGVRAADMARRHGAEVCLLETSAGNNFSLALVESAVIKEKPAVLFVTQGESSTGVVQPIQGLGQICHRHNCLLVVDTVASLGGVQFKADDWEVDCVYTGSQKVLGAPPGITPISFSYKAQNKIMMRKNKPSVYYLDMDLLGQYWNCFEGKPRIYHHTICATLLYGLREALALMAEEGIDECIKRHAAAAKQLHDGLQKLGLQLFVENPAARLPTVTTIQIPSGVDASKLSRLALEKHDFEIAGGLGPTAGKVFRIGVMGVNANPDTIVKCLQVLQEVLLQSQL